jgi:hypothetical protein
MKKMSFEKDEQCDKGKEYNEFLVWSFRVSLQFAIDFSLTKLALLRGNIGSAEYPEADFDAGNVPSKPLPCVTQNYPVVNVWL